MSARRVGLVLLTCALALGAAFGVARARSSKPVATTRTLEHAQEGDWCALRGTFGDQEVLFVYTVGAAAKDRVAVDLEVRPTGGIQRRRSCARDEEPDVIRLISLEGGEVTAPAYTSVERSEERRTVAGRTFSCTKVAVAGLSGDLEFQASALFSSEVKGPGLVAVEHVAALGAGSLRLELVGFGSKGKTEWGTSPVEITLAIDPDGPITLELERHVFKELDTIVSAELTCRAGDADRNGAQDFASLAALEGAKLIDECTAKGRSRGYVYTLLLSPTDPTARFVVTARPERDGRCFYADQTNARFVSEGPIAVDPDVALPLAGMSRLDR